MKVVISLITLTFLVGCDPLNFGYKKNPAYVLDKAFKSLIDMDQESFVEVSAKEFLCIYANQEGMNYLRENIDFTVKDVVMTPKKIEAIHYSVPQYVGYWSYYHERFQVEVSSINNGDSLMTAIIDCEFGTETEKNPKWINLKPSKYRQKECRLVKLNPASFKSLPLPEKCDLFKLTL